MPHRQLARFILAVLAAFAFVACSDQSPIAPTATPDGVQHLTILAQPSKGTYTMSFSPTSSGLGVILVAYVLDASNQPAQSGTAIFEFCSLRGVPAPSTDCDNGSGSWVHFGSAGIIPSPSPLEGHALLTYDLVPPSGTTIGFHFRYLGMGNGIANGTSLSGDHTF